MHKGKLTATDILYELLIAESIPAVLLYCDCIIEKTDLNGNDEF